MWCVGTLSSEDDGRQTFRHLRHSFRQSVQGNLLGFCHVDRIPEGAQGKLCVSTFHFAILFDATPMPNIKKTVAGLRRNVKHSFSTFLGADPATMAMEMADYTFKITKFTSHIVFIGDCLRKRLIPKGF